MLGVRLLLLLSWAVWIVPAILLHLLLPWRPYLPAVFSDMLTYGKLKEKSKKNTPHTIFQALNSVPRRYFVHFYKWGLVWNFLLFCLLFSLPHVPEFLVGPAFQYEDAFADVFLTITLLLLQTLRRYIECCFITQHSDRTMHAIHYVLGLYFYTAIGPTAMLHLGTGKETAMPSVHFPIQWRHIAAITLFLWASYHQFTCHLILAKLRSPCKFKTSALDDSLSTSEEVSPKLQNVSVGIPEGDWFQFVSCPHYFAEILIYCSLELVEWRSGVMLWPCLFVVCVLTLSARQTHSWYCSKFDNYPSSRLRIIPYVF